MSGMPPSVFRVGRRTDVRGGFNLAGCTGSVGTPQIGSSDALRVSVDDKSLPLD
jgi:hypothetical protein